MNKYLGVALFLLGAAIAVVPNLTDCASQGHYMTVMGKQLPMVCHWSARAEIATGIPLGLLGAAMFFTKRKSGLYTLGILGIALGVLTITLPTNIIGTCPGPTMICNTAMKPAAAALGGVAIVGSALGLMLARKKED